MNYPYSSLYLEGQWLRLKLAKLFHPGTDARGDGPAPLRIDHALATDRHRDCRQPGEAATKNVCEDAVVLLSRIFLSLMHLTTWSASPPTELSLALIGDYLRRRIRKIFSLFSSHAVTRALKSLCRE